MKQPPKTERAHDITSICIAVLFLVFLIGGTYWILLPFLPAFLWASMVVVSTWPVMIAVQKRLGGRRNLAVLVMTTALLLILIIPLSLAISTIADNTALITDSVHSLTSFEHPPPPAWVERLPVFGSQFAAKWRVLSSANNDDLIARASPYVGDLLRWFVSQMGGFGMLFVHFLLTVALSAVLYSSGESVAERVKKFAIRLAGDQGEGAVQLAAQAIRAVALGVVGTALCQSVIAGAGLVIAGIPQAVLLSALIFFFSVIQVGALIVMLPVVVWLYYSGSTGWAVAMLVWSIFVAVIDNVLRPVLIRKGANLPLLLIFAGVIGGLIAFGIIGLFVGPMVLAVAYTLLIAWIEGRERLAAGVSRPRSS